MTRRPPASQQEDSVPETTARKILITGARGFVGTYLRAALKERCPDAALVLLTTPGDVSAGHIAADLRDPVAVDEAVAEALPDVIIHLAAQASVARAARDNAETFAVNLGGSLNLALAIARHAPEATLLFASSSEVYGETFAAGRVSEESPLAPINAYSISKQLAETMFAAVLPESAKLIVARPFNHTGVGQNETFVMPSFVDQIARIEAGKQAPRLMVGNIDVRRDLLDVRDVTAAYVTLLDADLPPRFTCNVASGSSVPLRNHLDTLRVLARMPFEIVVDPARLRATDVPVAEGSADRLYGATGWTPQIPVRETLRTMLEAARRTHGVSP